jgi:ATP-dependent Clp protease adaptor protein ClpS
MSHHTQTDELVLTDVALEDGHQLILFNDDVNTFDFVIESLVEVCGHDSIQAEQCAYIVHFRGKCQIKQGEFEKLEPMCVALLDRGLTAAIEQLA